MGIKFVPATPEELAARGVKEVPPPAPTPVVEASASTTSKPRATPKPKENKK
jgi:hypothetical protein